LTNSYVGTIALHADGIAIVRNSLAPRLDLISHGGTMQTIDLPILDVRAVLAASPNTLYVTGTRAQAAGSSGLDDLPLLMGADIGVVRILDGALDPSFGTDGVAWANGRLLHQPITANPTYDGPARMGIDAAGPYVAGVSGAYDNGISRSIITITRFKP
jgi:hypothetical protein